MQIISGINKIKKFSKPVVALGVFDGLHRGHRNILKALVGKAKQIEGTSIVLTFFPHPHKQGSLYSLSHRLRLIAQMGVDICIVIKFTPSFAKISANDFIKRVLLEKISAQYVYVGENFHFGKGAQGGNKLLASWAKKNKFKLKIFKVVKTNRLAISSTAIRLLIKKGKIKAAQNLLGRRVSILGSVIKGSRLARVLGFPTANINPHHEVVPAEGIYAVSVNFENKIYTGICYIGKRPTICQKSKSVHVEVHIFNFHKNIYGKLLEIQFIKLIRKDRKFQTITALAAQIQKDIISCRKIHKISASAHNL